MLTFYLRSLREKTKIHQSASIFIKNIIKDAIRVNIPAEIMVKFLIQIFNFIMIEEFDIFITEQLSDIVSCFVLENENQNIKGIQGILELFVPILKDAIESNILVKNKFIFIQCLEPVLIAMQNFDKFSLFGIQLFDNIIIFTEQIWNEIKIELDNNILLNFDENTMLENKLLNLQNLLKTLYKIINPHNKNSNISYEYIKFCFNNQAIFWNLLENLLLNIGNFTINYENINETIGYKIYNIKKYLLKIIYTIFRNFDYQIWQNNTKIIKFCENLYKILQNILYGLCVPNFDIFNKNLDEDLLENLIQQIFKIYSEFLKFNFFQKLIIPNLKSLILDIVFPIFPFKIQKLIKTKSFPNEIVNLSYDLCTKHTSNILLSDCANLLYEICNHLDGTIYFICQFSFYAINFYCKKTDTDNFWNSLQNYNIVKFCNSENLLELGLFSMSILNKLILRREYILPTFDKLLYENWEILIKTAEIIKCRISLILQFYFNKILCDKTLKIAECINFLINGILNEKEKGFSNQCVNSLRKIIMKNKEILIAVSDKILPNLIKLNETILITQELLIFNTISELYKNYYEIMREGIGNLALNCRKRIISDINNDTRNIAIIFEIFDLLQLILTIPAYLIEIDKIENILSPLFPIFSQYRKFHLDDLLLIFITKLISIRKSLTPCLLENFDKILDYYKNTNFICHEFFLVMYSYLFYGKKELILRPKFLEKCYEISVKDITDITREIDIMSGKFFIILQILIQNYTDFYKRYYKELIIGCMEKIKNEKNENFIKIQLLGIILIILYLEPKDAIKELAENNLVTEFIENCVENLEEFMKCEYYIKIFIFGLSNLILELINSENYEITKILYAIITVLNKQYKILYEKNLQISNDEIKNSPKEHNLEEKINKVIKDQNDSKIPNKIYRK